MKMLDLTIARRGPSYTEDNVFMSERFRSYSKVKSGVISQEYVDADTWDEAYQMFSEAVLNEDLTHIAVYHETYCVETGELESVTNITEALCNKYFAEEQAKYSQAA